MAFAASREIPGFDASMYRIAEMSLPSLANSAALATPRGAAASPERGFAWALRGSAFPDFMVRRYTRNDFPGSGPL